MWYGVCDHTFPRIARFVVKESINIVILTTVFARDFFIALEVQHSLRSATFTRTFVDVFRRI